MIQSGKCLSVRGSHMPDLEKKRVQSKKETWQDMLKSNNCRNNNK